MQRITGFTPSFEHTYSPPVPKRRASQYTHTDSDCPSEYDDSESDTGSVTTTSVQMKRIDSFAMLSDPSYDSTMRRLTRHDLLFIEHILNSENIRRECRKGRRQ